MRFKIFSFCNCYFMNNLKILSACLRVSYKPREWKFKVKSFGFRFAFFYVATRIEFTLKRHHEEPLPYPTSLQPYYDYNDLTKLTFSFHTDLFKLVTRDGKGDWIQGICGSIALTIYYSTKNSHESGSKRSTR